MDVDSKISRQKIVMVQFLTQIIGGLIIVLITAFFGIGGTKHVTVHGSSVRKTGKWIIIFSVIMIFGGLAWAGSNSGPNVKLYGYTLAGYGLLAYIVGRIVAWFQKL